MQTHETRSSIEYKLTTGPKFGVAGFPPNFFTCDLRKKRENIFLWLKELGLDWIELQCTRGVKMRPEQAQMYRELADEYGIGISVHGPYFISLASANSDVVVRSRERILQCFALATQLGAQRIIFHPGFYPGNTEYDREAAVKKIIAELNGLKQDVPAGINIYPETAGKISQIGSLDEVLEICEQVDYARPCIDLAHIHSFNRGSLWTTQDILDIFFKIKERLGLLYINNLHVHMYPIDYDVHGEKKHKAFSDTPDCDNQLSFFDEMQTKPYFFPRAENFIEAVKSMSISPVVICEAYNTQDVGARLMKDLYLSKVNDSL